MYLTNSSFGTFHTSNIRLLIVKVQVKAQESAPEESTPEELTLELKLDR